MQCGMKLRFSGHAVGLRSIRGNQRTQRNALRIERRVRNVIPSQLNLCLRLD